jgi:Mn2+/Fe2+ NRAMP family transporter
MSTAPPSNRPDVAEDLGQALPMVAHVDQQALAAEKALLTELQTKPFPRRIGGYLKLSGPGWLQSAMTLGGGSAGASLLAGQLTGYDLLWVQPLAMALGIIMLSAVAYQVLHTGVRPFDAIRLHIHPSIAWGWALLSWISSIVWCFPQFSLSASAAEDIGKVFNVSINPWITSVVIMVLAVSVTWNYGKGGRAMRMYETTLKLLVALIILCFTIVVIVVFSKGNVTVANVAGGYSFKFPTDPAQQDVLISAFATAVGINMTFLFPYTLIARQWGKEHVGLARFDLGFSMMVPYVLATSFIIIASAVAFHGQDFQGKPTATDLAQTLEPALGPFVSHVVFDLGILGMTLSTITLLMLVSGFVAIELFKLKAGGWGHRLAMLTPAPGFLGPVLWGKLAFYMVVPTSVACFFMLPLAYISFFILHNKKSFMGDAMPRGRNRLAWNVCMLTAIAIVTYTGGIKIIASLG